MTEQMDIIANDTVFKYAAALVIKEGKVSTSFIQRKLAIGYNKAAAIVERMESLGLVSPPDHVGKRLVVTAEQLEAVLLALPSSIAIGDLDAVLSARRAAENPDDALQDALFPPTEQHRQAAESVIRKGRAKMRKDPDFEQQNETAYNSATAELRQFVEQYEQLEAEKKDVLEQMKEVMSGAKGRGYDTKVLKKLIALRKRDKDEIAEEDAILEMYKAALGMS